jgi:DNA-binding NtrC family response regulator
MPITEGDDMATILVVDDERMMCDTLRAVLNRHGHEVITASSGREALELFGQRNPRFTLLDLRMPEMNGIEVLSQIRAIAPQAGVIVLTGGGSLALENQARQLGVTDFLNKGLSLDVLIKAVERAMQDEEKAPKRAIPSPVKAGAPSGDHASESILVVDDELKIRDLISEFLTMRGYRVCVAHNGPTALALVEQERPDFIVTDMYMPGMDGLELMGELRAKHYTGGVLVLTASQDEKLLQDMLDLGSVDIMSKPVDLERLELAVQLGCILTSP